MSFLDALLGGIKRVANAGTLVSVSSVINFTGGLTATFNAGTGNIDISGGGSGLTSYGADLSTTSTATNQYVDGLSFSATGAGHGAGGAIAVNGTGTLLNWVDDVIKLQHTATTLLQLGATSADFIAFGTAPGSAGSIRVTTNTNIIEANGNLVLYTDVGPATYLNGLGTVFLYVTGTQEFAITSSTMTAFPSTWQYGGTAAWTIQWQNAATGAGATTSILGQNASGANMAGGAIAIQSGVPTGLGAFGNISFGIGGASNTITLLGTAAGTVSWASTLVPVFSQAATSGPTGANWTWTPQTSSANPGTGGNAIVSLQTPTGAGTEANFQVQRGATQMFAVSFHTQPTLYLNSNSPTGSAFTLSSDNAGNSVILNGVGSIFLEIANSNIVQVTGVVMRSGVDLVTGLGDSTHRWTNAFISDFQFLAGSGTINGQTAQIQRVPAFVRTTNAGATTAYTFATTSNTVVTLEVVANAKFTGSMTAASTGAIRVAATFVNIAGTVTQIGSTTSEYNVGLGAAGSVTFNISGTNVQIQVTSGNSGFTTEDWQLEVMAMVN